MLSMSLKSLAGLVGNQARYVAVVEDAKGLFKDEQRLALSKIVPELQFLQLGPIDWASIRTLKTELEAFSIVAAAAKPIDFIAKVDSDILFFSNKKLDEIKVCSADFVGDGHYSGYRYAQGGLYFMRAPLASSFFNSVTEEELQITITEVGTNAEDQVVSALVRRRNIKIWLTRLMLFPNEFERTNLGNAWVKSEFSAIHFVHKKVDMPKFSKLLG